MASPIYGGSRALLSFSDKSGVPLDQLNFVAAQFSALLFGFGLRVLLPHSLSKPRWRHAYCLVVGLGMLWFMIGKLMFMVLLQVGVCYLLIRFFPSNHMQLVVFFFALGYMLTLYYLRLMENFEDLCYDATYPLMITTQKVTTLAFSVNDWRLCHKKGVKLHPELEKWAVRDPPSLLEYSAFVCSFQGVLGGPFCHYHLYRAFIEGNTQERLQETKHAIKYLDDPGSCVKVVVMKLAAVAFWIFITVVVKPQFPDSKNVDPDFIANHNVLTRTGYLYLSLFFHRAKYYVTWIFADAVYNSSGLGYAGKNEKGQHQWTAMSNVFVVKIEFATSLKTYLDNWNILTSHWLRHVCYIRAPFMNTLLTFILSALWHGLFVGYYVTFVSAAFFVAAGRKIRSNIRPMFQSSPNSRLAYEIITFLGTQISLAFLVLSFVILHWEPTVRFHNSFYWAVHVMVLLCCILLPSRKSSRQQQEDQQQKQQGKPEQDHRELDHQELDHHQEPGDGDEMLGPDGDSKLRRRDVMYVQKS